MSDDTLSPEEEQILLVNLQKPRDLHGLAGALETAVEELRLAWRVRSALGWQSWPSEAELERMEAEQDAMRREYETENAKEPS